jgi:urease accessory protein
MPRKAKPPNVKSRITIPQALRAQGRLGATFERKPDGTSRAASLEEGGGYRMRFPRTHAHRDAAPCEGTVINTGGGMAGGDHLRIDVEARRGANVLLSTPSAERIYGSTGLDTKVEITLRLEAGSRLAWLPRETILFSDSRLVRSMSRSMKAPPSSSPRRPSSAGSPWAKCSERDCSRIAGASDAPDA